MGKAQNAPVKFTSTTRLELQVAVLATHLNRMLREELDLHIQDTKYWTDSTNNDGIADHFNTHFINVGPYLASKISKSSVNPTQYISFSSSSSFVMSSVTETQVSSLFKTLDANKSSTDIPNKLIKLAAEPLSVPFTKICNQSIEIGIVPNILKMSQVTPLYKNW